MRRSKDPVRCGGRVSGRPRPPIFTFTTREWMLACFVVGAMVASRNHPLITLGIFLLMQMWLRVLK